MNLTLFNDLLDYYRVPGNGLLVDSLPPNQPSGNALLYEAHAAWIHRDIGEPTGVNLYEAINQLEKKCGLFNRKPPPAKDGQSHDDYTGITSVSFIQASNVCHRGLTHGWFYDNNRPNATFKKALRWILRGYKRLDYLKYWHARIPGQVQHYRISAGQNISFVGWCLWLGSIAWTVRKPGNTSGWLLDYLKLRSGLKHQPEAWAVKLAVRFYKKQLNKHYAGNIKNVYAGYFGHSHPFALYSDWPKH